VVCPHFRHFGPGADADFPPSPATGILLADWPPGPAALPTGAAMRAADFVSGFPQSLQNRAVSSFSCPQKLQVVFTA